MPRKVRNITVAFAVALGLHLAALWGYAFLQTATPASPGSAGVRFALGPANQVGSERDAQVDFPDRVAERPPEPVIEERPPKTRHVPVRKKPPGPVQTRQPSQTDAQAGQATVDTGQSNAQNILVDGTGQSQAQMSYLSTLAAWLEKHRRYPPRARLRGQEGVVRVRLTISRSGQVLAQQLSESSGFFLLDREALATIKRAEPLPAFPPELKGTSLAFTLPIRFSID